jgi:drug/metabolite transporter (DMT)-like permease
MLWIFATLVAAAGQTARNAMQINLTASLGTLGATQVRFIYGFPFALLFLALVAAVTRAAVPGPTAAFVAYTSAGALAQIFGTVLLLEAMRARAFSVATAFTKTEAVQVAIFGFVFLGDALTSARIAAIAIATAGVIVVAAKPGTSWSTHGAKPTLCGIASGGLFAIAAVAVRGGILALGDGPYFLRATTTLVWCLGIQAFLLGGWLLAFDRAALARSLAVWRQSLAAGFMGAFASQFWFVGFSLTAAANVRTLALVEVLFAQAVSRRVFGQRVSAREAAGMALVIAGVALLLVSP